MKALLIAPFIFLGCIPPQQFNRQITPTSKMELTTFYVMVEDSSEFFANVINFVNTGDMWILWTKYTKDPEFTPIFRIDHHDIIWTNPYSRTTGIIDQKIKDTVAEYFKMSHEYQKSGKVRKIKLVSTVR